MLVSMRVPHDQWIYGYILSFGAALEVIEPQSVRDEIVRLAEKPGHAWQCRENLEGRAGNDDAGHCRARARDGGKAAAPG